MGWLTAAFAASLLLITFGLSWRAQRSQERWTRLIDIELQAVATLEELIREQNGFTANVVGRDARVSERYRLVEQLLDHPSLRDADLTDLRGRIEGFRRRMEAKPLDARLLAQAGRSVVLEAQSIIEARKFEINRQIPRLQRDTREMGIVGIAVAWIVILIALAVATSTVKNVVKPVEALANAAKRIGSGDVSARAPITGDRELVDLGHALNEMADELKKRARTDDLTLLPNFRAFREHIEEEIRRATRYSGSFGILVLDLDRFKQYNDTYGHLAGNDALQRVARAIQHAVRAVDFPARYGGEEFAVIVPHTDAAALHMIAERIRTSVEAIPAPANGRAVTISIGGALYPSDSADVDRLFQIADERLYEAKRLGRNCAVVATAPAPAVRSAG